MTEAHTAEIWDIKFHPGQSDSHLFTAGEDGRLLHWNTNVHRIPRDDTGFAVPTDASELDNLSITTMLATEQCSLGINTIDIDTKLLACGTDSGALMILAPAIL